MTELENTEPWGDLIQAWIDKEGVATIKIAAWQMDEAYDFGRFLADVARHGSLAFATTHKMTEAAALEEICKGLSDQLREQVGSLIIRQEGSLDS